MDIEEVERTNNAAQQPQQVGLETPPPQAANDHENDWNDRFARLTLRERQLLNEKKQMTEKLKRIERLEGLRDDPDALLREFGHSYDSLTERRLEKPKSVEQQMIEELKSEIADLKGFKSEFQSRTQQEEQQRALQNLMSQVDSVISDSDDFEFIRTMGEQQLVIDTAAEFYKATGKKVDLNEAAKWVEKHLEDKFDGLAKTKKWSSRFSNNGQADPSKGQAAVEAASQNSARSGDTPSLSNSLSGSPSPGQSGPENSEDVLRQRAIRLLSEGMR
jgi:hypothetical protein